MTSQNPTKYYWLSTPDLKMCIIFCCFKDLNIPIWCNMYKSIYYSTVFINFILIPNSVNHGFCLIYLLSTIYILHVHVFFYKSVYYLLVLDVVILYGISFLFYWIFASLLSSAVFSKTFVLSCLLTFGNHGFSMYSCI